jgi:hypothetical protein
MIQDDFPLETEMLKRANSVTIAWKKARFLHNCLMASDHVDTVGPHVSVLAARSFLKVSGKTWNPVGSTTIDKPWCKIILCDAYGTIVTAAHHEEDVLNATCVWKTNEDKEKVLEEFALWLKKKASMKNYRRRNIRTGSRIVNRSSNPVSSRRTPIIESINKWCRTANSGSTETVSSTRGNEKSTKDMAIMSDVAKSLVELSRKHNTPISNLLRYFEIAGAMSRPD